MGSYWPINRMHTSRIRRSQLQVPMRDYDVVTMEEGVTPLLAYKAGDVIQGWIKPFIKVMLPTEIGRRCANCFKRPPSCPELKLCSGCQILRYCSPNCQRQDWEFVHFVECSRLPTIMTEAIPACDPYLVSIVTRICAHFGLHFRSEFQKFQRYNNNSNGSTTTTATVSFWNLSSKLNGGLEQERRVDNVARKLAPLMSQIHPRWNAQGIRHILGLWNANSYSLVAEQEGETKIGGALYLEASDLPHSCRPNAQLVYNGEYCMQIRCIGDIPQGEPPTISYLLPGLPPRAIRQQALKDIFGLDRCHCSLCEQEMYRPAADYELILDITESALAEPPPPSTAMGRRGGWWRRSFEDVVELRDRNLGLYKQLLHPFDERVTNFATDVFNYLAEHYLESKSGAAGRIRRADSVQKLADDTLRRLEVSFGKEYWEYQSVKARMAALRIRVPE